MKSKNLNYAFNIEYYEVEHIYENLDKYSKKDKDAIEDSIANAVTRNNEYLFNFKFTESSCPHIDFSSYEFSLKTKAPGMLSGIGTLHSVGTTGELSLGFSFDYVTGVPYLPGSTVKGVLKSAFEKEALIKYLLHNDNINVKKLSKCIFEDNAENTKRDTFFDCYISSYDKEILDQDFVTPHGKKTDGSTDVTKNPKPIKFIKIRPNVVFDFKFNLTDTVIDGVTVTAQQKCDLFRGILMHMGIGAKTNVGYGALCEVTEPDAVAAKSLNPQQGNNSNNNSKSLKGKANAKGSDSDKAYNSNNTQVGKCKQCGEKTSVNPKTGKLNALCQECFEKNKR